MGEPPGVARSTGLDRRRAHFGGTPNQNAANMRLTAKGRTAGGLQFRRMPNKEKNGLTHTNVYTYVGSHK
jgi:hypothetical protein